MYLRMACFSNLLPTCSSYIFPFVVFLPAATKAPWGLTDMQFIDISVGVISLIFSPSGILQ